MAAMNSVVIICPIDERDARRAAAITAGVDVGLGVPLSATGASPATHCGAHVWLADAALAVLGDMTCDVASNVGDNPTFSPVEHFAASVATHGLARVEQVPT